LHCTPKEPNSRVWNLELAIFLPNEPSIKHADILQIAAHAIKHTTDAERVAYDHACFGYPPISTFIKAVRNGWLHNFEPSLTTRMITTNQPVSKHTGYGFLDQTPSHTKATSNQDFDTLELELSSEESEESEEVTSEEFAHVKLMTTSDFLSSSDLTGALPLTTTNGYNYILVSIMENYVHFVLMKSRTHGAYEAAFTSLYTFYKSKGKRPKYQCLDNEVSTQVTELFKDLTVEVQFVPPSMHRANVAERAIRHAKNTVIAMVSAVEEDMDPRIRFERVITQAEIAINHLKPCSRIPSITAWEGMHNSKYDFQAHPISIYGMRAIVHEKPEDQKSWDNHGVEGFYLGPSLNHYRCWDFYIPKTQRTHLSDTVQWLPRGFQLPGSSPLHRFEAAFDDLRTAITELKSSNIISAFERQPASNDATTAMNRIRILDNIMNPQQFQRVCSPEDTIPSTITPAAPYPHSQIVQSPTSNQYITSPPVSSTTAPQRVSTLICSDTDKYSDDVKWETVHFNKLPKPHKSFSRRWATHTPTKQTCRSSRGK